MEPEPPVRLGLRVGKHGLIFKRCLAPASLWRADTSALQEFAGAVAYFGSSASLDALDAVDVKEACQVCYS